MARKNPKTSDAARPLSCVLYIRVSTKLQVEKGESIDTQRFELTRYAENHDMRMLMTQIDSLDPADRSYERKFNDLQRRLDDLYDRDAGLSDALEEAQAKMTTAEKRMDGERRLLEELDRIPELLEGADEQTRFDFIHEAVSEVHILPDKNPRKERVVANEHSSARCASSGKRFPV